MPHARGTFDVALKPISGADESPLGRMSIDKTFHGGAGELTVTVIPDSGTGDLVGISGTPAIVIADGKHSYDLDYAFAPGA